MRKAYRLLELIFNTHKKLFFISYIVRQVPDPRAPEYMGATTGAEQLWDMIWAIQEKMVGGFSTLFCPFRWGIFVVGVIAAVVVVVVSLLLLQLFLVLFR